MFRSKDLQSTKCTIMDTVHLRM